jgi:hypothetical protein
MSHAPQERMKRKDARIERSVTWGERHASGEKDLDHPLQGPQTAAMPLLGEDLQLIAVEIWCPNLVLSPLLPDLTQDCPSYDLQVLLPGLRDLKYPQSVEQRTRDRRSRVACRDVADHRQIDCTLEVWIMIPLRALDLEKWEQDVQHVAIVLPVPSLLDLINDNQRIRDACSADSLKRDGGP